MNCIDPPALTTIDLASYLDGEADVAIVHHIAACPACRATAIAQAQQQNQLSALFYRSTCPTPEEIRDYRLGLLNRADESNVALHVAHCPHCTRELLVLHEFLAAQTLPTVNPLQQFILHIAKLLPATAPNVANPLLAGQRGNDSTLHFYQADEFQIGFNVIKDPGTGQRALHGMIAGGDLDNLLVHLWCNGQLLATVAVDPLLGDFQIPELSKLLDKSEDSKIERTEENRVFAVIVSAPQVKVYIPALHLDE